MNLRLLCDESHRTFVFSGEVLKPIAGVHPNLRSLSLGGLWNAAVDLLVQHRFSLDLSSITLQFGDDQPPVSVNDFLNAGGFDEALESPSECMHEFWLRFFEANGDDDQYTVQLNKILAVPLSPRLKLKMDLRRGRIPEGPPRPLPEAAAEAQSHLDVPRAGELTLCVTFGDAELASQFLKSLVSSAHKEVTLHLVACCFRVSPNEIEALLNDHRPLFNSTVILPESWSHEEGEKGGMGPWYSKESQRKGVSWGRCVLHRAAALFSPTEAMWILDDDVQFQPDSLNEAIRELSKMKAIGRKVGIGAILGDGPVPPSYMARTQTIDFYYAQWLPKGTPAVLPVDNVLFHDLHHDLSTEGTFHLEYPFGLNQARAYNGFNCGVLQGKSLTRTVHRAWNEQTRLLVRGGNTLVLGKDVMVKFPNVAPKLGNIMCRRGDTLWSKRIQAEHPEWIGNANLALTQRRPDGFDFGNSNSVRGDILGSMLVRFHDGSIKTVPELLSAAFNREARLVGNLKRTLSLLRLMDISLSDQEPVRRLVQELEQTPWPEGLAEDIKRFIKTYPLDAVKFQQAQGR